MGTAGGNKILIQLAFFPFRHAAKLDMRWEPVIHCASTVVIDGFLWSPETATSLSLALVIPESLTIQQASW